MNDVGQEVNTGMEWSAIAVTHVEYIKGSFRLVGKIYGVQSKRPQVYGQNVPRSVCQNVPKPNVSGADQIFFSIYGSRNVEIKC